MNRAIATAVLSLALIPAAGSVRAETWREQSENVIDTAGIESVRVENSRGLIRVTRGADGRVRLTALKIARGRDREHAVRFARETRVTTSYEKGRLEVRVIYPQRQMVRISFWDLFSGYEFPRVDVRLGLEVPGRVVVSLGSTSGDLETEGLGGAQKLNTTSGDVTIHGAGGAVEVSSTSGDVMADDIGLATLRSVSGDLRVDGARGVLRLRTTSGDIRIAGAEDSLVLATVSGDIRADAAPRGARAQTVSGEITVNGAGGTVGLESSSGDVEVSLRGPLRHADVATASGSITATLAERLGCALDLKTSSGTLDVSVPLDVKTVSRRVVAGTVGNGAAQVRLRSSSGDIAVRRGGS